MKIDMNEETGWTLRILSVALILSFVAYCTSQTETARYTAEAECYKSNGSWSRIGWSGTFGCIRNQETQNNKKFLDK